MDSSERRRLAEGRLVPRSEAWAQAAAERTVELVVSALDVNALLDQADLNAVLDQVDIDRMLDRVDLDRLLARMDLNDLVRRIDFDALVEQTDLGAVIAASSSGAASDWGLTRNGTATGDSELNPAALPPTVVPMWTRAHLAGSPKPQPNQRKPSLTRTIRPALPAHCP